MDQILSKHYRAAAKFGFTNRVQKKLSAKFALLVSIILQKNASFRIKQHVESDKHKKLSLHTQRQSVISFETEVTNKFFEDLTHSSVAANIPFNKLQNESFKSFLEKWTGKSTPDDSTIRKNYLPKEFKKFLTRSSRRQRIFKEVNGLPLPPVPVLNRWSS